MTKIREGNNKMFFFIGDNCFCQMLWMEEVGKIRYKIIDLTAARYIILYL